MQAPWVRPSTRSVGVTSTPRTRCAVASSSTRATGGPSPRRCATDRRGGARDRMTTTTISATTAVVPLAVAPPRRSTGRRGADFSRRGPVSLRARRARLAVVPDAGDGETVPGGGDDDGTSDESDPSSANRGDDRGGIVDEATEETEEDDEEDEYEEVEVEVDYTVLDHARDAIDSLGAWSDVAGWGVDQSVANRETTNRGVGGAAGTSSSFKSAATAPVSAAPGGKLGMAPTDGVVVALAFTVGAIFGRRQAEASGASKGLAELVKSGGVNGVGGVSGELRPMTEEERIADEKRRAERKAEKERREAEATKKRKEDEAKFLAAEKKRLEKEAAEAERARVAEEERRARVRAELAERAEIERAIREEKEAKEREERERREREAEEELRRRREEEARLAAERLAAMNAEKERRGETLKGFDVAASVTYEYRAGAGDVEVEVRARCGISSPATLSDAFPTSEKARRGALEMCSAVAKSAVANFASDQRVRRMTDPQSDRCLIGVDPVTGAGFDDAEFDHWMRVSQARTDAELRTLVMRGGAAMELKIRQPGGAASNQRETSELEFRPERASLPGADADNVSNRLTAAAAAALDNAYGVASEDLDWVARYELSALHGLDASLCFPAVSEGDGDKNRLKGTVTATMLTLSHWIARAKMNIASAGDAGPGLAAVSALEELASQTLSRVANAEGASWKAMYLDGFSGDAVTRTAATARVLLEEDDVIRLILERTEEEHLRKLMNQPTLDEEQFPDREEARRMRYRAEKDAEPLAERLWAMRNSAAQLAQSGARAQARTMLEEAYTIRIDDVAKRREASGLEPAPPGSVAPEALPELLALEECFRGEPSWDKELAGVRGQVLKAVRAAAARSLAMNDAKRAAALLEGAAREYGSDRKLGATHVSVAKTREAADEAWRAAGIEADDEEAKDAALASVAGTPVPRGQGGGIVMKLGKTYLEELEIRRK